MLSDLARNGTYDSVRQFLQSESAHRQGDLDDALSVAAFRGDERIVTLLLDSGANPNAHPPHNLPPLHCAVEQRHGNIIYLLISRGADVNVQADNGFAPLHWSVDIEGDSAWQAGREPSAELTELLLKFGADPCVKDHLGRTPFDIAQEYNHGPAMRLLGQGHRKS